jgi:hypothetical protein
MYASASFFGLPEERQALGAVGQALHLLVDRVEGGQAKARHVLAADLPAVVARERALPSERAGEPPSDQIASLPARAAFRFSGHCAIVNVDAQAERVMFFFEQLVDAGGARVGWCATCSTSGEPSGMSRQPSPSRST